MYIETNMNHNINIREDSFMRAFMKVIIYTMIGVILMAGCKGSGESDQVSSSDKSNVSDHEVVSESESKSEDVKEEEVVVEVLDEEVLLASLNGYYGSFLAGNPEGIGMYLNDDEESVSEVIRDYTEIFETGTKYMKKVSGINVYNFDSEKSEVYVMYALEEARVGSDSDTPIEEADTTTSVYGSVFNEIDGIWKLSSEGFLESMKSNDTVNGNYGVNPEAYIVDYIDWYLENEDVQVNDKVFYQITSEEYMD